MRYSTTRLAVRLLAAAVLAAVAGLPALTRAQSLELTPATRISGTVGVVGEAYTASGISNRRDATSAQIFGRAASNGARWRYGFRFLLATEQTGSRQAANRISANAGYRWLGLTLGDLSPRMSRYSLNGSTVRGGSIEATYGPYMATLMYGRLRRAVEPTGTTVFRRDAFDEWLYAARIGAGEAARSHAYLIGVVARDRASSLPDTTVAAPAENVSITPDFGLVLFDDRLRLRATYTLAAYSADTRADEASSGVSSMLGFFTPRVGSRIDYAADVSSEVRLRQFRIKTSYERIQPGFRSLGLPQLRSDQAIIRVEPSVVLADRRANLSMRFRSSRNNLAGNRASTLKRRLVSLHGHFRLSQTANLVAAYTNVNTRNDLELAATLLPIADQRNVAQTIMLGPTLTFPSSARTHVVSVNTSYQFLRDRTPGSAGTPGEVKFDNLSATAAYSLAFSGGLSLNATGGMLSSKTPTADAGAVSLSAGASTALAGRRARVSLTGGWSRNTLDFEGQETSGLSSRQLSLRLTGTYRLAGGSTIRLTTRGLRNSGELTGSFNELQVSLRVEQRF